MAADTYTKLFGSILASTIWQEPDATRLVWITMLAMCDRNGVVQASVPGLAHMARVDLQNCAMAIEALSSPDQYSRTPDNDGRRIEAVPGGWRLLNHGAYREKMSLEDRRAYKREWDRTKRGRPAAGQSDTNPTPIRQNPTKPTHTDTDTDTDTEEAKAKAPVQPAARKSDDMAGFEEFWAAYPVKKGKEPARKAWIKAKVSGRVAELVAHVRDMQANDRGWRDGFVPHAATYLNQARWNDVPEVARAAQGQQQRPAPIGRTMQGVMALEGLKRGQRLDVERGTERPAALDGHGQGPDAGRRFDRSNCTDVD